MKEKFVVTIARQFGSLGRPIARMMSEKLGIEYYDRDIVDLAAKKLNLPVSTVSDSEESAKSAFFNMNYPLGLGTTEIQDKIFAAQQQIITDLAAKSSCIIVGRCAEQILSDTKNLVRIFIYAPYEARLVNCVERLGMTPNEAVKMISTVDKARDSYHRHYCGYSMSDKAHKEIMIDSSFLGIEKTSEFLTDFIRAKYEV